MREPDAEEFLPPESGQVTGIRLTARRRAADLALDLLQLLRRDGARLDELAARVPPRRVLLAGIYRPESQAIASALRELRRTRHSLTALLGSTGEVREELADVTVATGLEGGKFQNLNAVIGRAAPGDAASVIERAAPGDADWSIVIDDDVVLPRRFLDRFLALCESFGLALAQPAQTQASHAAWGVTRRRPRSLLRETRFVEVGPVTAFSREAAAALIPFPELRFGWGLDSHWAAVASKRGWRLGIADAVPVRHEGRPIASAYRRAEAVAEARRYLAGRPYLRVGAASQTVATHRDLAGARPP